MKGDQLAHFIEFVSICSRSGKLEDGPLAVPFTFSLQLNLLLLAISKDQEARQLALVRYSCDNVHLPLLLVRNMSCRCRP